MKEKTRFSIFALSLCLVTVLLFVVSLMPNNTVVAKTTAPVKRTGITSNKRIDYVSGPSDTKYFTSKEDAQKYALEMEKQHQGIQKNVEEAGGEYVYEVIITDKSTNEILKKDFASLEELNSYVEEVKKSFDSEVIINDITVSPSIESYKDSFNETFKNYADAQKELNEYIEKMEEQYGTIISYEITEEEKTTEETTVESKTEVILATDLEEYKNSINHIYNEYLNQANKNEVFSLKIQDPVKVGEKTIEHVISSENGTLVFDTLDEAKNKKAELEGSSTNKVVITTSDIREKEETSKDYDTFTKTFETEDDALMYLETLKQEGYTIENYSLDEVATGNKLQVNSVNKIDRSQSSYSIDKSNNYLLIKQGSGVVAIWTEVELSLSQRQQFMQSYFVANNVDGSTTEEKIKRFEFIHGYGSFDLSFIGNNWGTYTFTDYGNTIVMECEKERISHLNYGQYEVEKSYQLTVNVSKPKVTKKYEFYFTKTVKEIEVVDQLEISYTISKHDTYYEYHVQAEAQLPESYHLEMNYTHPQFEVYHHGNGSIEITDTTDSGLGSTFYEPEASNNVYLPPKTGIQEKTNVLPITILALGILFMWKKKMI